MQFMLIYQCSELKCFAFGGKLALNRDVKSDQQTDQGSKQVTMAFSMNRVQNRA